MAISLANLRRANLHLPPLNLIYGAPGLGKTSLALEAPNTVYIQVAPEAPPRGIEPVGFGELISYEQIGEAMKSLYAEKHVFTHVVIDSMDALEPLIWQETCRRNNWQTIETPGFGKGYLAADDVWREFITRCERLRRERGLQVTWLGLADASNHEEPGQQPYKRYAMKLHKRGHGLLTQAADAVLFINTKVTVKEVDTGFNRTSAHAEGGGTRWLFTDGRPAFEAKNRFNMPDQIALPKGKAWAAIAPYLSSPIAAAPAVVGAVVTDASTPVADAIAPERQPELETLTQAA